jgi:lipopolysaccharide/colanic/teichoic acid biosynthesis glycosyltransferase
VRLNHPGKNSRAQLRACRREKIIVRCFDLLGASAGLIMCLPLLLVLAVLIKLDSPGPALYRQRRTGRNRRGLEITSGAAKNFARAERRRREFFGRTFMMYKLRTMRDEAERRTGPVWAMPEDPRITDIGRRLRKHHLDEIPQLWNVIKGEMSLVGPRPERPEIIARLVQEVPEYRLRLRLKPGITGPAQLCRNADAEVEDVKRKLELDLYYAAHFSVRLYLRTLFLTAVKIFSATPVSEAELMKFDDQNSCRFHTATQGSGS